MGTVTDRRKRVLAVLAAHPTGLLMEDLIRQAGAPTDRPKLVTALRHLAAAGAIRFERQRPSCRHHLLPPVVRSAVTSNG